MNKVKLLFNSFLVFTLLGIPTSGRAAVAPDPTALLISVLNNPAQAYQGQMLVSSWSETGSKAEEVRVYFYPPSSYRFEFLTPDGSVDRVVMSSGSTEKILIMNGGQIGDSYSSTQPPRLLTAQDENKLVTENYKVTALPSEKIMDRDTWVIELTPLTPGKPHQIMRIDRNTRVALEIKRYMPEGKTGSITRFTKFSPGMNFSSNLFVQDTFKGHDGTTFQTSDLIGTPNSTNLLPTKLYGGFSLETGDRFEVNGKSIRHLRYTDGLLPVSIFTSPLPVKAPEKSQSFAQWNRPLEIGSSSSGQVYQWKKDDAYYILIGDVQQDFLQQMASQIK